MRNGTVWRLSWFWRSSGIVALAARRHRVVSLVTHADIPDIVWADDETGCYGVLGRDAKGKPIVVERFGPIRIVTARR